MDNLLTVTEVADYLRTTTTTVYRWLKQGKLSAVKIGKEWRISEGQLKSIFDHSDSMPCSFWERLGPKEHLLLVTEKNTEITEFEVSFFKQALSEGSCVMKGCWWQDTDDVCEQYRHLGLDVDALIKDGLMKIIDFKPLYRAEGANGPVRAWSSSARQAVSRGFPRLWASGSPVMNCCGSSAASLLAFESSLNHTIQDLPVIGVCPYSLEHKSNRDNFNKLMTLIDCHSGVVFHCENQYRLLRQSFI